MHPTFVLVRPQMGENIGAVARVISNFGFTDLILVNPRDGWPNNSANAMAAHGLDVIEKTIVVNSMNEAVANFHFVYAASTRIRDMHKPNADVKDASLEISKTCNMGKKVAILLGCESTGLQNKELLLADSIFHIKTSATNPSLNLAQAACVIAYELSYLMPRTISNAVVLNEAKLEVAPRVNLDLFVTRLIKTLESCGFFANKDKEYKIREDIMNLFLQGKYSEQQLKMLYGIEKALSGMREERNRKK